MREPDGPPQGRTPEREARRSSHEPVPVAPRLVVLFIVGAVLFGFPLLTVFNLPATVLGVPLLYAYLFVAWGVLIALVATAFRSRD